MVHRIYPAELQLNKANASDTEAAFLDLYLSISNDTVFTKIYDKVLILLISRSSMDPSYDVHIPQLNRFARASSHASDFNGRNKFLTGKLLRQCYRYHKLHKSLSKHLP